jgi:hypothetical protein
MSPVAPGAVSESGVALVRKEVDPAGVRFLSMSADNAPVVRIQMSSSLDTGEQPIDYAYRVDRGFWRPFTRERILDVEDGLLRLQGRHTIEVRSRAAGQPMSLDPTPASLEVLIDAEPPTIAIGSAEDDEVQITVQDFVSGPERTQIRTRLDDGAWSDWRAASSTVLIDVGGASAVSVEARDEEGNIASTSQAIIRGGAVDIAGGCGCITAGTERTPGRWSWLVGLAFAGLARRPVRRQR